MEEVRVKDVLAATGGSLLCGNEDALLHKIRLDSRMVETGDLFVPMIGEKVDAHRFLDQVAKMGAGAVLTCEHSEKLPTMEESSCAWIAVPDTKKALQALGAYLRNRLSLPIVGVTGSVGKTTTREMIAAALSAGFRVYKTPGNSNSQVGVPITISEIGKADEIAVLELGMSEPGELTVIAQIAKPDLAVITNIGITHIEQLGSRENIYKEKMSIQDGLSKGGVLILNGDDDLLCKTRGRDDVRTVYYGTGANSDYRATDILLSDGKAEFIAVHEGKSQKIRLNVMGVHNVMNAIAAIAVACERGMTMEAAAQGLLTFHGFKHRQQVFADGRFTVMDDSYNASPASMKAALDVFQTLSGKRHIAILADMKELGENTLTYHREVGQYAASCGVTMVVTLGEFSKCLADGVREKSGIPVVEFENRDEMIAYLKNEVREGDCLLFKGSNSMGLSAVADRFVELARN